MVQQQHCATSNGATTTLCNIKWCNNNIVQHQTVQQQQQHSASAEKQEQQQHCATSNGATTAATTSIIVMADVENVDLTKKKRLSWEIWLNYQFLILFSLSN